MTDPTDPDNLLLEADYETIRQRTRALESQYRIFQSEYRHLKYISSQREQQIKMAEAKIERNKQLPYLVANVVEVIQQRSHL